MLDVIIPLVDGSEVGRFFQELVANHVIGQSGIFSFVAVCQKSTDGESLSGHVHLISRKLAKTEIRTVRKALSSRAASKPSFTTLLTQVTELCENHASASAEFVLERGGKFEITLDHPPNGDDPEICQVLANQFFYFFKDISHVHQHHDPKLDAITEVHLVRGDKDESWRDHTVNSLYRSIIRFKRFRREKSLFRASGILAYSKSFERKYPGTNGAQRTFHDGELDQSLSVARDEIKHFDNKRISQIEATRGFFFALFGLVMSGALLARLSPIGQEGIEVHSSILWLTKTVANAPYETVAAVVFVSVIYQYLTHKKDPADIKLIRNLVSIFQGFRLRWHVISNAIVTGVFCLLAYIFLVILDF
ncbi:MAG: hypothetical protein BM560_17850 [Roseobacter sp. MedPE-SWde]|nr:MAG: hypothetical protein BM560_17850 [Roseobacter sp. MedPE-SWde]